MPHRLIARGSQDAEVLLVASPVSSSAPPLAGWLPAAEQTRALPGPRLMNFSSARPYRINLSTSNKQKESPPKNLPPR
jgi:hypothetical protein